MLRPYKEVEWDPTAIADMQWGRLHLRHVDITMLSEPLKPGKTYVISMFPDEDRNPTFRKIHDDEENTVKGEYDPIDPATGNPYPNNIIALRTSYGDIKFEVESFFEFAQPPRFNTRGQTHDAGKIKMIKRIWRPYECTSKDCLIIGGTRKNKSKRKRRCKRHLKTDHRKKRRKTKKCIH